MSRIRDTCLVGVNGIAFAKGLTKLRNVRTSSSFSFRKFVFFVDSQILSFLRRSADWVMEL